MKATVADGFRDWVGLLLLAIGWNADIHAWVGGVIMAMGGASLARAWRPERDMTELWAVIGGAFFAAHLAGTACLWLAPEWPVQTVMALTGFFSRWVIKLLLDIAEKASGKGSVLVDRGIDHFLPGGEHKGMDE